MAIAARCKGYRYPIEVIGHAVWLYHRFALSLRDVEELMVARGVVVTYETIRSWCAKFGPDYAAQLRRRRPRPGDKWHLDEVFVKINGATHYLWRAVDQHGDVLDILVQSRRNAVAAKRFFRKLLTGLRYVPRVLVTDKLASYQVAHREVLPSVTIAGRGTSTFILSSLGPGHHLGNSIGAARVLTSGVLSVWVAGYRTLGRAPC